MKMTAATRPMSSSEELRQAILDGRISADQAFRAILEAVSVQVPAPSTQLVLDRLTILQSTIEMKVEAAFLSRSGGVEPRSPLLLSFLENWRLIALVAIITSVETACLAYLLAR
jgi:hypothetical protein